MKNVLLFFLVFPANLAFSQLFLVVLSKQINWRQCPGKGYNVISVLFQGTALFFNSPMSFSGLVEELQK
jgi:hypothetical protein